MNDATPIKPTPTLVEKVVDDLKASGLEIKDMMVRVADMPEKNMIGVPGNAQGYIIPYFDLYGKPLQFYRMKVFNGEPKYRQAAKTPNHVYIPKGFMACWNSVKRKALVFTEGEKKAAAAVKRGIPTVAFGGADSWINRTILIPKESEVGAYTHNRTLVYARLPAATFDESLFSTLAVGLQEILDMAMVAKTVFYICFDSDSGGRLSFQVQRAAAKLGLELRYKGFNIGQIRHIVLPNLESCEDKIGLDDFLVDEEDGGPSEFAELMKTVANKKSAFPRHPNIREFVNKQLQKPKLDRKQTQNLSLAVITDLDARGRRMWSPSQLQLYYFDQNSKFLMKCRVNDGDFQMMQETDFGKILYRDYGLGPAADQRIFQWFGAQFAAEDPIEEVDPHRIIASYEGDEDICRIQINDGEYVKITGDPRKPFECIGNGAGNVLFESGLVKPITAKELKVQLDKRLREKPRMWWQEVLAQTRLRDQDGRAKEMAALLYYISPWLNRWRGTQLPVELMVGEAGSGKSTLAEVRLNIITGDAQLRNAPNDLKDWNASIGNSGGLHVTDNVHLMDKNLKQRMSDELCRLVTDPNPRIEMRKYFTEADTRTIKIGCVFAFTAIQMPFLNADLLQRSITLEFNKATTGGKEFSYDSHWKERILKEYGGRAAWLSHHMHILHLFFKKVEEKWDTHYKSKHRLVNLEQSLILMSEVFGIDGSWIPEYMVKSTNEALGRNDWVLEGMTAWCEHVRTIFKGDVEKMVKKLYDTQDMVAWFENEEDFDKNHTLTNTRSLGRWLQSNTHAAKTVAGLHQWGKKDNRMKYYVGGLQKETTHQHQGI